MLFALFTLKIKIYSVENDAHQGYVVVDIRKKLMHPEIKDKNLPYKS